jgi:hypothetical protein
MEEERNRCENCEKTYREDDLAEEVPMKLLTKEIRKRLPPIRSTEGAGEEAVAQVKFFTPDSSWTWYAVEGGPVLDGDGREVDYEFFGLVYGLEREFGYFHLSELESVRGPLGLAIERDLYFTPRPLSACEDPCRIHERRGEREGTGLR